MKTNHYKGKSNAIHIEPVDAQRVHDLVMGKPFFPEFLEIFPTNPCNHNCIFCISADYRTDKEFLPSPLIRQVIDEAAAGGTPQLRFCGGGEPLLHPDIADLIRFAGERIHSVNLITNGSMMYRETLTAITQYVNEVRISMDAGTPEVYGLVHGTKPGNFSKVLKNLEQLVRQRGTASAPFIELSFVLLEENLETLETLVAIANEIGVNRLNVTNNTFQSPEEQRNLHGRAIQILDRHKDSHTDLYIHPSPPDLFDENTSLPCPAFLLYGVLTANGHYYSSCHHVGTDIARLGTLTVTQGLKELLSTPEIIEKQLNYAFGQDKKCMKLIRNPINLLLLDYVMQSPEARAAVTDWMGKGMAP